MKRERDVRLESIRVIRHSGLCIGGVIMLLIFLLVPGQAFAAGQSELEVRTSAAGGLVTTERIIDDSSLLISVSDAAKKPVFGLTGSDFMVTEKGRTARILSVKTIAESQDITRHIILVLDNSDSMRQRNAIEPLLAGVDELLKILRPIDRMQIVVFTKDDTMKMGGRQLHVKTFSSNQPAELRKFVADVYRDGITPTTVLYEAMLAGLELVRALPKDEPRFMVVFSDGEDLNSSYKGSDVLSVAKDLGRFRAFGIDYMPAYEKDRLLMQFAEDNNGELWKATSETSLVPIFQSVASQMQYFYIISYLFPTTGSLAVAPAAIAIDHVLNFDAAATDSLTQKIDSSSLTLSPAIDTAYGITSWKVALANNDGALAVKAGEGTPASEIVVPFNIDDLNRLAAGGDIIATMELQDRKGQSLVLSAPPVKVNHFRTTGSLAVAPAAIAIDDIVTFDALAAASLTQKVDVSSLTLSPVVNAPHGVAGWDVAVANNDGMLATQSGQGAPDKEIIVPLETDNLARLASGGDIRVRMEVRDRKGQTMALNALPVKVSHFKTTGSLAVAPAGIAIDDVVSFDAVAGNSVVQKIDSPSITVRPTVNAAHGVASWKVSLSNNNGTLATQTGEGAPTAEIAVPLKTDNLAGLAAGGDIIATMQLQDRKGQSIVLSTPPVKVNHFRTTGSLAVAPAAIAIDDVVSFDPMAGDSIVQRIDSSSITLRPTVSAVHGVASWKIELANYDGTLATQTGEGAPASEIVVPLKTDRLDRLIAGGNIRVSMEVQDRKGQTMTLNARPVDINHFRTTGSLGVAPAAVTIEEVKTIDSSPMLGYLYFGEGESEIPARYVRLVGAAETTAFDEQRFRSTLEKHYQVLNIIGKRLTNNPEASITLTGCNANTGRERSNRKLSTARAEAVRDYLQTIWSIAPERIRIEARNLPEHPSTNRLEEGRAENRRVEISSNIPAILAPVRSTYLTTRSDTAALTLRPVVKAPHGVSNWKASLSNSRMNLGEASGQNEPPAEISVPLRSKDLDEMATAGDISVRMQAQDSKGQNLSMTAAPVKVSFIQTSQRMAQRQDFRVQEKYALILFDFDSDSISARNQDIVNAITARIKELPDAATEIVGHTDTIGKEAYNMKLSMRRALAVYKLLNPAYGEARADQIRHRGVGQNEPLYENLTPEARAFNRTVTITLEYMAKD